jgi:hypothetical protein
MKKLQLLACTLALVVAVPAVAGELHGVKMADKTSIEGKELVLNGIGLRTKAFIKVYVAALYTESKSADAAKVIAPDTVKRVEMVVLRDLGKKKIADAIEEGFEKNSKSQMLALRARLDQFKTAIPDLEENEKLTFTYVPGKGTIVAKGGAERAVIPGKDFADALFSVWLGASPVDGDLKKGMLGSK